MSLKLYKLLYGNLMLGLSFGAAFAIFGSASWFFRVAPINLRTSRIPAMESNQRVVLEVSNYLERDGGPRRLMKSPPVVHETPKPEELPQAEVIEVRDEPRVEEPRYDDQPQQEVSYEAPAAAPDAPPFQQNVPFEVPPAAPEAPVEIPADAVPQQE
jgi:hypothetical protein